MSTDKEELHVLHTMTDTAILLVLLVLGWNFHSPRYPMWISAFFVLIAYGSIATFAMLLVHIRQIRLDVRSFALGLYCVACLFGAVEVSPFVSLGGMLVAFILHMNEQVFDRLEHWVVQTADNPYVKLIALAGLLSLLAIWAGFKRQIMVFAGLSGFFVLMQYWVCRLDAGRS